MCDYDDCTKAPVGRIHWQERTGRYCADHLRGATNEHPELINKVDLA